MIKGLNTLIQAPFDRYGFWKNIRWTKGDTAWHGASDGGNISKTLQDKYLFL